MQYFDRRSIVKASHFSSHHQTQAEIRHLFLSMLILFNDHVVRKVYMYIGDNQTAELCCIVVQCTFFFFFFFFSPASSATSSTGAAWLSPSSLSRFLSFFFLSFLFFLSPSSPAAFLCVYNRVNKRDRGYHSQSK